MFTTFNQNNLTTSLRGRLQNNSTCFKGEHSDRQTHKIGHNILSCSLVSLHFITPLSLCLSLACICTHTQHTHTKTRLEILGGRPWTSLSRLVPGPTRKQLIMCERLSECLLSGQQQHSAIYLPSRQNKAASTPCRHALSHPRTYSQMLKKNKDAHSIPQTLKIMHT